MKNYTLRRHETLFKSLEISSEGLSLNVSYNDFNFKDAFLGDEGPILVATFLPPKSFSIPEIMEGLGVSEAQSKRTLHFFCEVENVKDIAEEIVVLKSSLDNFFDAHIYLTVFNHSKMVVSSSVAYIGSANFGYGTKNRIEAGITARLKKNNTLIEDVFFILRSYSVELDVFVKGEFNDCENRKVYREAFRASELAKAEFKEKNELRSNLHGFKKSLEDLLVILEKLDFNFPYSNVLTFLDSYEGFLDTKRLNPMTEIFKAVEEISDPELRAELHASSLDYLEERYWKVVADCEKINEEREVDYFVFRNEVSEVIDLSLNISQLLFNLSIVDNY
ncbi:hypothetical protein ACE414_11185 [Alteromonas macleodii]|uniref:hypothetical protein n=1 Tax=Alteromonas macleodii TaxID=28108 RepID=UPI0036508AED